MLGLAANPLHMQRSAFLRSSKGGQGKTGGAMPRHINEAGLAMIKSFEGLRLDAYRDPVGIWTIGYGHTLGVQPGMTLTEPQATDFLRQDLAAAESSVGAVT